MYNCSCCQHLNIPPTSHAPYTEYKLPHTAQPKTPHSPKIRKSHLRQSANFYIEQHPQKRFNPGHQNVPLYSVSSSTRSNHPNNLNLPCSASQYRHDIVTTCKKFRNTEPRVRNMESKVRNMEFYHHYEEVDLEEGSITPVSDDNNEELIDEFFDGLESEIAWSMAVCESVFNRLSGRS